MAVSLSAHVPRVAAALGAAGLLSACWYKGLTSPCKVWEFLADAAAEARCASPPLRARLDILRKRYVPQILDAVTRVRPSGVGDAWNARMGTAVIGSTALAALLGDDSWMCTDAAADVDVLVALPHEPSNEEVAAYARAVLAQLNAPPDTVFYRLEARLRHITRATASAHTTTDKSSAEAGGDSTQPDAPPLADKARHVVVDGIVWRTMDGLGGLDAQGSEHFHSTISHVVTIFLGPQGEDVPKPLSLQLVLCNAHTPRAAVNDAVDVAMRITDTKVAVAMGSRARLAPPHMQSPPLEIYVPHKQRLSLLGPRTFLAPFCPERTAKYARRGFAFAQPSSTTASDDAPDALADADGVVRFDCIPLADMQIDALDAVVTLC